MAYILSSVNTGSDGTASTSVVFSDWFSGQIDGDTIIVAAHNDGGGTALSISGTWTALGAAAPNNSASRTGFWATTRSGSNIPPPTITGANDEWAAVAILVRDGVAIGSWVFEITEQAASTLTPVCPSVTTVSANNLAIYICGRDGNSGITPLQPILQGSTVAWRVDNPATTANSTLWVDSELITSVGATDVYEFQDFTSDGGRQITIAIPNVTDGIIPPHITSTDVTVINQCINNSTSDLVDLQTFHSTLLGISTVNSTVAPLAGGIAAFDITYASIGMRSRIKNITKTQGTGDPTGIYGTALVLGGSIDLSNRLLCFRGRLTSSTSTLKDNHLYLRDALGGWIIFKPTSDPLMRLPQWYTINVDSLVAVEGPGVDSTQITHLGIVVNASSTVTFNRATGIAVSPILSIPKSSVFTVCGGSLTNPITPRQIAEFMTSGITYALPSIQGQKQQVCPFSVKIGNGGVNATFFKGNVASYEMAASFPGTNILAGDLEWRIDFGAGDNYRQNSLAVGSGATHLFTIQSGTSAATSTWAGTVFGLNANLNSVGTPGLTYVDCAKINAGGANLEGCRIEASIATDAAVRVTNGSNLSTTRFIKGAETYAIEVLGNGPQTIDILDTIFEGYTTPINVLGTTGTITFNISSGQTEPAYTSAGATVVFSEPVVEAVASVTGFTTNSRVIVYNVTTSTEILNTKVAGTSWTLEYEDGTSFSAGDVIDVYHVYFDAIGNTGTKKTRTRTVASLSGWSVLITEENCDIYEAYVSTYSVNGSTITEFTQDGSNVQVDIDDPDNIWFAHRLFAWDKYEIWNGGSRLFFEQISASDAGNISIGTLLLDNLSTETAKQGDTINVFNSSSTLPVENPTTGGGGLSFYSGGKVLLTSSGGIAPSEAQIRSWVRAELAIEMGRIDVPVSSVSGGGGLTASDVWSHSSRTLTENPGITLANIEASNILAKEASVRVAIENAELAAIK
jgi:hypothetical protein